MAITISQSSSVIPFRPTLLAQSLNAVERTPKVIGILYTQWISETLESFLCASRYANSSGVKADMAHPATRDTGLENRGWRCT